MIVEFLESFQEQIVPEPQKEREFPRRYLGNITNSYTERGGVSICRQVQKKHMDTHTHTSHQDAAESHRQQQHESLLLPA